MTPTASADCAGQWSPTKTAEFATGLSRPRRLTPDQMARYGEWFDNAERIRALVAELEALSLRVAERNEDWPPNSR